MKSIPSEIQDKAFILSKQGTAEVNQLAGLVYMLAKEVESLSAKLENVDEAHKLTCRQIANSRD